MIAIAEIRSRHALNPPRSVVPIASDRFVALMAERALPVRRHH